jgi:hypothetical protein
MCLGCEGVECSLAMGAPGSCARRGYNPRRIVRRPRAHAASHDAITEGEATLMMAGQPPRTARRFSSARDGGTPLLMYDHNQLEIPDSFMALYLVAGRLKPLATRKLIAERYEFCEDLANHLCEYARAQHHDLGITECEVLLRCHRGLQGPASGLVEAEPVWVIRRLAELEGWECPDLNLPDLRS